MYEYLRVPSCKKPLSELDQEAWYSAGHPRGDGLKKLLEVGRRSQSANACKTQSSQSQKRSRAPSIFEIVNTKRVKTLQDLQHLASSEAEAGNSSLAEYCTRQGHKLQDQLDNAWAVVDSKRRTDYAKMSLMEKLKDAAVSQSCVCQGRWATGALQI